MKSMAIVRLCLFSLSLSLALLPFGNSAQAQDFVAVYTADGWGSEIFTTLPITTGAISFDSEHNLYASEIYNDWGAGIRNILRLEPPDYDSPLPFMAYDTNYGGINGMDFDPKGNLFVSEFMGTTSGSDLGAIRKIEAHTNRVSEPIEFEQIPSAGDFRPTGIAVTGDGTIYFPGRKHSVLDWGNIYRIDSFIKYDPATGPEVLIAGLVATAIEVDQWGGLYIGSSTASGDPYDEYSVYAENPYTGEMVKIAEFSEYVEELTFDSEGNLYALEGVGEPDDDSTIIELIPPYISIDGCDTGIVDWPFSNADKISAMIAGCADMAVNHGEFVSCVVSDVLDLKQDGLISANQMSAITSCAAQAAIP